MTTPELYDVEQTAKKVRLSVSWLYHNAGVTIPVTRIAGTKRLFWTDEQIEQIIRDGAQPAKAVKPTSPKREPAAAPAMARAKTAQTSTTKIPQGRPERSRRYRPDHAA
jgi:hypothetical protein